MIGQVPVTEKCHIAYSWRPSNWHLMGIVLFFNICTYKFLVSDEAWGFFFEECCTLTSKNCVMHKILGAVALLYLVAKWNVIHWKNSFSKQALCHLQSAFLWNYTVSVWGSSKHAEAFWNDSQIITILKDPTLLPQRFVSKALKAISHTLAYCRHKI